MTKPRKILILYIVVNLILLARYFYDRFTIQCEPCLDSINCPPCETKFMSQFWFFMGFWNILMVTVLLVVRKMNKVRY